MTIDYRRLLLDMFRAAVNAAAPAPCVPVHLPPRPKGRTIVVGAGKAVAGIPYGASGTTNLLRIASLPKASL
jgi:glycerate 2-kinase